MGGLLFTEAEGLYLNFKFKYINSIQASLVAPPASSGDVGLIPGCGRSLEKEMATHSQYSCLKSHRQRESDGL